MKRAYYYANMLLLDSAKAGFSRDALVKALKAEGVRVSTWVYPEQHKLTIYSEATVVAPSAGDSNFHAGQRLHQQPTHLPATLLRRG